MQNKVEIFRRTSGPYNLDTYFLVCCKTGESVIIDPGENLDQLIAFIRERIMVLDKKTIIHPGHHHTGIRTESTLEKEIKENIYITDFILER